MLRRLIGTAGDIQEMAYARRRRRRRDARSRRVDDLRGRRAARRRHADAAATRRSSRRWTSSSTLYDREGVDHRRAHRLPRPRRAAARAAAVDAHRSSRPVPGRARRRFALGAARTSRSTAGKPVLFFSMEMGHLELTKRLLAAEAQVDVAQACRPASSPSTSGRSSTRRSAGSPRRRSSSTTTRTAR